VQRCGTPLASADGSLTHAFPTAGQVAVADLDGLGLTGARVRTLRALATAVANEELTLDATADRDETRRKLAALPGVGPWTVEYVAMRALADPDAFPDTDLVLQRQLGTSGRAPAERWRPWRAYAAMHLWTTAAREQT
jgi:AraC family transcriptional regulator of adaptative response / DNA-3-methyladenine glycosylase II